jgi:hypothetical protein
MAELAPEQAAITACVRRRFGQDEPPVATENLDWDGFLTEARDQGLAPVVYGGLPALSCPPPHRVTAALRANRLISVLRHQTAFEPALRLTIGALHDAGLEPIVLKGGALTYLGYPKPGLRTMSDIDLLLAPDQLQRANEALCALGFHVASYDLPDHHHHLPPLFTPDGRWAIELHHHVLPEANPYAIDMHAIRARARLQKLGDVSALVLAPEDALLHICAHLAWGHRYQWFPLRTLVDILALTSYSGMDWDQFLTTVCQTRTAGAVYWPLRLSQSWLKAPVPTYVLTRLAPSPVIRWLLEGVIESPYLLSGDAPSESGTSVLYTMVRELSLYGGCSRRQQAAAVWRSLFPAPDAVSHLPPEVTRSPFRYALRLCDPFRLLRGLGALCALTGRLLTRPVTASAPRHASAPHGEVPAEMLS